MPGFHHATVFRRIQYPRPKSPAGIVLLIYQYLGFIQKHLISMRPMATFGDTMRGTATPGEMNGVQFDRSRICPASRWAH